MKAHISLSLLAISGLTLAADPVITIGPISDYTKPPTKASNPQGSDIQFVPSDANIGKHTPKEGIDVFFGPDLQKALSNTLDGLFCATTQDCSIALAKILDSNSALTIQSRAIGFLTSFGAVFAAYLAFVIKELHGSSAPQKIGAPKYVHVPAHDLSRLHSVSGPVIFEAKKGSPLVTATPMPAPTPKAGSSSITILSEDRDGHKKGEMVITLPKQQASILDQLIRQTGIEGKCKAKAQRRSGGRSKLDYGALNNAALFVLPMAAPGQLLADLGLPLRQLPQLLLHLRDDAAQASLEYVQREAAKLTDFAHLGPEQIKAIAEVIWKATYDLCVGHVEELTEIVLDSALFMEDPHLDHDEDDQERCARDRKKRPKCEINRCKGIDGVCQQPKLKGCPCLQKAKVYWSAISRSDLDAGQRIIGEILGKSEHLTPKLKCEKDKRVNLEYADYLKLSEYFCKDTDLTKKRADTRITPSQAGTKGTYPDSEFSFSWKPTHASCSASCTEIFSVFNSSTVCSYDSHTMAASGSRQLDCGIASYNFKNAKDNDNEQKPQPHDKLYCGLKQDSGNANHFVSLETMTEAAQFFCEQQTRAKTHFPPGKVSKGDSHKEIHYNENLNDPVYISVDWLDDPKCPEADFRDSDLCNGRLATIINDCDTSNPHRLHYWKQGGTLERDCIRWTIKRDKFASGAPTTNDSWRPSTPRCKKDKDCDDFCKSSKPSGKGVCRQQPHLPEPHFEGEGWCRCTINTAPFEV